MVVKGKYRDNSGCNATIHAQKSVFVQRYCASFSSGPRQGERVIYTGLPVIGTRFIKVRSLNTDVYLRHNSTIINAR